MSGMNLPNKLTVARCFMALIFVGLMSFENAFCYLAAYFLFVAAAITDYYDGKIARERNLVTNFGKLLDPVADKVLMVAALIMLMTIPDLRIPGWTIVLILGREFLVTGARSLAAAEGAVIAANKWGKTKTVLQMVYVSAFLLVALFPALNRHVRRSRRVDARRAGASTDLPGISVAGGHYVRHCVHRLLGDSVRPSELEQPESEQIGCHDQHVAVRSHYRSECLCA